ncbi:PLB1 Phospholipase, partial [Polypterus senegalus]
MLKVDRLIEKALVSRSCDLPGPPPPVPTPQLFSLPHLSTRPLTGALLCPLQVNFQEDWKLVTLFIGGNDLCQYCLDRVGGRGGSLWTPTWWVVVLQLTSSSGLLAFTSGDSVLAELRGAHSGDPGHPVQRGQDSLELMEARMLNRYYQVELEKMVYSGRYDGREDFAVVTQPFFRSSFIPLADDGTPDVRFFSSDCFHFSERGHAMMAISLWNNMLEPVGQKTAFNNFTYERRRLKCPSQVKPYFFTKRNSFPLPPVQPAAPSNGIPSWTVVVAPSGECWWAPWASASYGHARTGRDGEFSKRQSK